MKRIMCAFLLLFTITSLSAQRADKHKAERDGKLELKLNIFDAIVFAAPELSAEYLVNENVGIGLSTKYNFVAADDSGDVPSYFEWWTLTPYFRHFYSRQYAEGFFLEGFLMANSQKRPRYNYYDPQIPAFEPPTFNFALGFSIGAKFVTDGGFDFEFLLGLGRNIFRGDSMHSTRFVPRCGIALGYRL